MLVGEDWDKLRNRYEAKWLVYQYIDVLIKTDESQWLCFEGITSEYNVFSQDLTKNMRGLNLTAKLSIIYQNLKMT